MRWWHRIRSVVQGLFQKRSLDGEMDEEMRAHLDLRTQANIQTGMSPEEARYAALRGFGGMEQVKEICRDLRGGEWLAVLGQDVRYGLRMLGKNPGGMVVIVTTLSLLLGAMSFAVGIAKHYRASQTPFPQPDRLVRIWRMGKERPSDLLPGSIFTQAGTGLPGFQALGVIGNYDRFVLTGGNEPQSLVGVAVSSSLFEVAGVRPLRGRTFRREEDRSGERVVVLGYELWINTFGGEESVLGQAIRLNDALYTVIGVMPEGFERNALFGAASIWVNVDLAIMERSDPWIEFVARLKPGVTRARADAQLRAIAWPIGQEYARAHHWPEAFPRLTTQPITKRFGHWEANEIVLAGMIPCLVALIAGFNVTTILLGRMMSRRQEMAVRHALGARRGRLVRLLLTESIFLALAGSVAGLLGAYWIARWSAARAVPADFSLATVGLMGLAAVVIGIVTGLVPALRVTRCDLIHDLKEAGTGSGGPARHRLRNFLVTAQVAMTTALCVAAGLLTRSYVEKQRFNPGFDPRTLVTMAVTLREPAYKEPQSRMLYCEQALERLRATPGVREASVSSNPAVDRLPFPENFGLEGAGESWASEHRISLEVLSPNHLGLLHIPVLRGRGLREDDRAGSEPVMLVNQSFVRRYFPAQDPLGRRLGLREGEGGQWFTIVGVVPDRRNVGYREDYGPEGYLCARQVAPRWASYHFHVRTSAENAPLGVLRNALRTIDPSQPVSQPATISSLLQRGLERDSGLIAALSAIGLFGLLMSLIGIYGVASYAVVERTHEIGVRVSLGATQQDISWLVLKQGLRLVLIGLAVGALLAVGISVGLKQMLFGIPKFDPITYLGVGGMLAVTALLASYLPARKAARIKPMLALRYE